MQVVPACLQQVAGSLLAVQEHEHVPHVEPGVLPQKFRRLNDAAAAGHEVVDEKNVLALFVDALDEDTATVALLGRMDVDHRHAGAQCEGGGEVQSAERDSTDALKVADLRVAHRLQGSHLLKHDACCAVQRLRLTDK